MARQIRIVYAGATHQVVARGNHGQAIYGDEQDRKVWLEVLARFVRKQAGGGTAAVGVRTVIHGGCLSGDPNDPDVQKWSGSERGTNEERVGETFR